ncbi:MAG: type IX secretion system sortase PorU [Mariniphaga sp.]
MKRILIILFLLTCQKVFPTDLTDNYPLKAISATNSVLASGRWTKFQTTKSGIHRITFAELSSMGFTQPQKVRFFGAIPGKLPQMNNEPANDDLKQLSVWQTKDKQQVDCLLIYIPESTTWKYDPVAKSFTHCLNQFAKGITYLYLTEDISTERFINQANSIIQTSSSIVTDFDDLSYFEEDEINILESGSRWFSNLIAPNTTFQKSFVCPDRIATEPVKISVATAARCEVSSSLNISGNGKSFGTQTFVPYSNFTGADYADLRENAFSQTISGDGIDISMKYNSSTNGKCWLDFVSVVARRKLNMPTGQLIFQDSRSVGQGKISEFQITNAIKELKIWKITNPLNPIEITSEIVNNILKFKISTDSLHRFIAFDPLADFPQIEKVGEVSNQNLHGLALPDMIIVTTPSFKSEAERLALFHKQNNGMEVAVVSLYQIYNEFSGGIADVTAIRNFVRHIYRKSLNNGVPKLKYLLLFGKGTYDNVHEATAENPNYIPTWQSEGSLNPASSFVSDDYYGLLGDDEGAQKGIVDIGIGRIPCETIEEAKIAVDKTLHYCSTSTMGEWRNVVCFVGDDEDNNVHVADSERLANFVNLNFPSFSTDKIYLDAFKEETTPVQRYPDVNKALSNRVKHGALIINYIGHANDEGLAHEKILTIGDIDSWSNYDNMPVFVTATCEFSRWDFKNKQSAGEHVLFNSTGGGVALFSTTRLVYSSSNFEMNKSFFKYVFQTDKDGGYLRMGDIIRLAKSELGGSDNAAKFALLGDPALQLSYPKHIVKTLEINNVPVEQWVDTLKPLSLVKVWGQVQDFKDGKVSAYNGMLYPTVYDKPEMVSTLGNGGQQPFSYSLQNSVLFKGNVSVKNGEFSYSFKIPKEINYRMGNGMIRYYSKGSDIDANGSYTNLKLGGSPNTTANDITGPTAKLYLDNQNFVPNGQVSKAPLLMADLEDESGINTSGSGIGHDITAILDDNMGGIINLNNNFQSSQDSYKAGKILYQLPGLSDGMHTLKFKVWDLANNSTESEVVFFVNSKPTITRLIAYPNPVKEFTDIKIEHNRFGEKMLVKIEIFNQQGMVIDQISTETGSSGFVTQPIRWTPASGKLRPLTGVYHFRVRLTTVDGISATKTGQLMLVPK